MPLDLHPDLDSRSRESNLQDPRPLNTSSGVTYASNMTLRLQQFLRTPGQASALECSQQLVCWMRDSGCPKEILCKSLCALLIKHACPSPTASVPNDCDDGFEGVRQAVAFIQTRVDALQGDQAIKGTSTFPSHSFAWLAHLIRVLETDIGQSTGTQDSCALPLQTRIRQELVRRFIPANASSLRGQCDVVWLDEAWRSGVAVANLARVCNEPAAIRVMVYDVLSHSNTIQFIRNTPLGVIALSSTLLAMMCVWPAAFRHQASDQASLDHLGKTVHVLLVELITQASSSTGASLDHPQRVLLAQRLQNLHGRMQVFWGAVPDHDQFQQLVLELVASLQHTLTDPCSEVPIHSNRGVCNLAHALQLVGLYMGWEWLYNEMICQQLWGIVDIAMNYNDNKLKQHAVEGVVYLLGELGQTGLSTGTRVEQNGVNEIRRCLVAMLEEPSRENSVFPEREWSIRVQVAAAASLAKLCAQSEHQGDQPISTDLANARMQLVEWTGRMSDRLDKEVSRLPVVVIDMLSQCRSLC